MSTQRYIGGGRLFFAKWNGSTFEAEVEIGEVSDVKLTIEPEFTKAYSKATGVSKLVETIATDVKTKLSFATQDISKENLAMSMLGAVESEDFVIGDTLPDGTVATQAISIPYIDGGKLTVLEGAFRFVGVNLTGNSNPVLKVVHAAVIPSGDARDYFAKEHAKLSFTGEPYEVNGEVFKEYQMPKA